MLSRILLWGCLANLILAEPKPKAKPKAQYDEYGEYSYNYDDYGNYGTGRYFRNNNFI